MADYSGLSADRIIQEIARFNGNIAMVAQAMHRSRQTIYNYIKKHPSIEAALRDERETMIDNVESRLYKAALDGEAWAVCFFLKTQAKHRGYIERAEITGAEGSPIVVKFVTKDD